MSNTTTKKTVIQCPNCGSVAVKPMQEKSKWDKNTGYQSQWKSDEKMQVKYVCQEFDCQTIFEDDYVSPKTKQRLTVDVDFREWTYEIKGKPFQTRKGTGINLLIFRPDGLTYLGAAFGSIADEFLERNLENYWQTGELNYDKNKNLKIIFND